MSVLSWTHNRQLLIQRRLKSLKAGDAYYCPSKNIKIIYIFKASKVPHFVVFQNNKRIFPAQKTSTESLQKVLEFILSFKETDEYYLPDNDMIYQENGAMHYMQYSSSHNRGSRSKKAKNV